MVDIKHIRQINDGHNWKCGAACLEMIFSFYGIEKTQEEIWTATLSPRNMGRYQYFIKTHRLANFSCMAGLPATIYKAKPDTWAALLDEMSEKRIPAILSLRQKKSNQSHFVVYSGKKDSNYCFCDPDEEKDINKYDYRTMKDIWSPQPKIEVTGYILIVFGEKDYEFSCPCCKSSISIVNSWIEKYAQGIICPTCDKLLEKSEAL